MSTNKIITPQQNKLEMKITLLVTVPEDTPAQDDIYISGNHQMLGNWSAQGARLKKVAPFQYRISLRIKAGKRLQFKFTRGAWSSSVEKDGEFEDWP